MKKIVVSAIVCVMLISYGISNHEDNDYLVVETPITNPVVESQSELIVLPVYHDATNSAMIPSDFRAMFSQVANSWETCGIAFELTNDRNARIHINWGKELEADAEAYAQADLCGANFDESSVTLSTEKFKKLTPAGKVDTLAHELGHIVCVDHSDNHRSLMFDTLLGTKQKILASDLKQCIDNLPHLFKEKN